MVQMTDFNMKVGTRSLVDEPMIQQERRSYLGMSAIGHPCSRYLWYSFRWCFNEQHTSRLIRLFNRGHREEPVVIAELEKIGIKCYGDQTEVEAAWGHCKGHCDGICDNVPEAPKTTHLLEIKTMNDKNFKDLQKQGVKFSKPVYYAQCQAYMRKLKLKRALFIAVNKNDDNWYVERISVDISYADDLFRKAESIVLDMFPPTKIYKSTWFMCRWCSAADICHRDIIYDENCRTCKCCEPAIGAVWNCTLAKSEINIERQLLGCVNYEAM